VSSARARSLRCMGKPRQALFFPDHSLSIRTLCITSGRKLDTRNDTPYVSRSYHDKNKYSGGQVRSSLTCVLTTDIIMVV